MKPYSLLIFLLLLTSPFAPTAHSAGREDCYRYLKPESKSADQQIAETILREYKPYLDSPLSISLLNWREGASVFLGVDPKHPDRKFVLKVTSLQEALNDYYALKVLRDAQAEMVNKIKIVDSVLLTQKSDDAISLVSKVLQKNSYAEGRPLHEILADPAVPVDRKTELKDRFELWRKEITQVLEDHLYDVNERRVSRTFFRNHEDQVDANPNFIKSQPKMTQAALPWRALFDTFPYDQNLYLRLMKISRGEFQLLLQVEEDILIILKSDNIIVNEKNELILIDPF